MRLDARIFRLAKDPEHASEYQDACRADVQQGVAVIADGVTSAIFSGQWAELLVEAVAAGVPDPGDPEQFAAWLQEQRKAWAARIDTGGLAWFQRAKLPTGAFSTLLWVRVEEAPQEEPGAFGALCLRGYAIGDSCLFHVRQGELVRTFPIQRSEEFQASPLVLGSVDLNRDHLMKFSTLDVHCYPDDVLALCTDALAEWALRRQETGDPPDWDRCWDLSEDQWQAEIADRRSRQEIRYDDTTLLLLRVQDQHAPEAAAEPPDRPAKAILLGRLNVPDGQPASAPEQLRGTLVRGINRLKKKALEKYRERFGKDER